MHSSDKKNQALMHIGPIISKLLSVHQVAPKSTVGKFIQINNTWAKVVGAAIAGNTKPIRLKDKVLFVNVTSSVWIQELQFTKHKLVVGINTALGEEVIEDIKFKVGRVQKNPSIL